MPKNISSTALLIVLMLFPACTSTTRAAVTPTVTNTAPAPTLPPTRTAAPPTVSPTATKSDKVTDPAAVIKNYAALIAAFDQKLKTTGWIQTIFTQPYFNNAKGEYDDPQIKEEWYRFDADGQLVEAYNWLSAPDGAVQQEALYQNGAWYNVTFGGPAHQSRNTKVDFTGGFGELLKSGEKITQEAIRYHDVDAWRFFFEMNDGGLRMARAEFLDRSSGVLCGNETYLVQSDGTLKLVSGVIYSRFEINADPPLDRFQQIVEKAQKMR